jgi:NADPH2:quinone reductase
MKALRVPDKNKEASSVEMSSSELSAGDVHLQVHYSSLNYKDALAVTGKGAILKKFPLNPGIDLSGVVLSSSSPRFTKGQKVLITGCGTGEEVDGGFAEEMKAQDQNVIPLPEGMSLKDAMFFGTAGFTAALAVHRLLQNDQTPEKGPLLVTGASGGVGNFSVALLNHLGFEVTALSGKKERFEKNLKELGAKQVVTWEELHLGGRPLEKGLFGGAVDNVGNDVLSKVLAHVRLWGNVASIGLAGGAELHTSVMPFILRGVSLLGISSNNCTLALRHEIWKQLAGAWKAPAFRHIAVEEIGLEDVLEKSKAMLARKTYGRTIVRVRENE